ncbi:MAG: hypothetical protein HY303_15435 [Candidatus Wallbacteria bacterium]|nr:hypothetical protein [Candidatus Wallbacteria bacterium]
MAVSIRSFPFAFALAVMALAAWGCADLDTPLGPIVRPQSQPRVVSIAPAAVTQGVAATVTVSGTGFLPEFSAFVGTAFRDTPDFPATQVRSVEFLGTTRLLLHLPGNLPAGLLTVTIINPDDGLARLARGLNVQRPSSKAAPDAAPNPEYAPFDS